MKRNIFGTVDRLYRALCAALMGLMALTVILSVFSRYALSLTTVWSEELITVLFIATSFLGTAMVAKDDEHISIDFIYGAITARGGAVLRIFVSLIVMTVMGVVFYYALPWIAVSGDLKTPGLELPFKWLYGLLPTSCALVCLVELRKIVRGIKKIVRGETAK